jgi:glutamine synthetase adenylyltransferase
LIQAEEAERAAKEFAGRLASHKAYVADFRLRPEGRNAPLATEIQYYKEYLSGRASLWERQSLTKARYICGNALLRERYRKMVVEFAFEVPLPGKWHEEIHRMREKMEEERSVKLSDLKVGKGGLVDLEFALQILQLRFGGAKDSMRKSNSLEVVREIGNERILSKTETSLLGRNILFMRTLESLIRLNTEKPDFVLPDSELVRAVLRAFMKVPAGRALQEKIRLMQKQNRRLFRRALHMCKQ